MTKGKTKAEQIIEGLQLLLNAGGSGDCDAQRDELYADGPPPSKMGAGLRAELERLHWRWDVRCESWTIFV